MHKSIFATAIQSSTFMLIAIVAACAPSDGGSGTDSGDDEGTAEGSDDGSSDGAADGATDGAADGATDGATEGSTEGASEGQGDGSISWTADGTPIEGTLNALVDAFAISGAGSGVALSAYANNFQEQMTISFTLGTATTIPAGTYVCGEMPTGYSLLVTLAHLGQTAQINSPTPGAVCTFTLDEDATNGGRLVGSFSAVAPLAADNTTSVTVVDGAFDLIDTTL